MLVEMLSELIAWIFYKYFYYKDLCYLKKTIVGATALSKWQTDPRPWKKIM